jgi:hypothetical protein
VTADEWMLPLSTRQARIPHEMSGRTSGLKAYTRPPSIVKEKANGEDKRYAASIVRQVCDAARVSTGIATAMLELAGTEIQ